MIIIFSLLSLVFSLMFIFAKHVAIIFQPIDVDRSLTKNSLFGSGLDSYTNFVRMFSLPAAIFMAAVVLRNLFE